MGLTMNAQIQPPTTVCTGIAELRGALGRIHVMHECDSDCPPDCEHRDGSEAAYRRHDEHNADVREDIAEAAERLLDALTQWLPSTPPADADTATARMGPGAYAELEDTLYQVVGTDGARRVLRQVDQYTGAADGTEITASEHDVLPARSSTLRWYAALRLRRALDEHTERPDGQGLVAAAAGLAALVLDGARSTVAEVAMCSYRSTADAATVVEIDSAEGSGRLRVMINDGVIYDGDPETDNAPGAHYDGPAWPEPPARQWEIRDLRTGDTHTVTAADEATAIRCYLETVTESLLIWEPTA